MLSCSWPALFERRPLFNATLPPLPLLLFTSRSDIGGSKEQIDKMREVG